jgi:hypothetical protein
VQAAAIADALAWLDAGAAAPPPSDDAAGTAVARDGDVLVLTVGDDVPLARVVPLARHVLPTVRDGVLELRVTPADLAADRAAVVAALHHAID